MREIENRQDIDDLMRRFYHVAIKDEKIGYIFTNVAKLDLEKHLPVIGDFWESLLLGSNKYQKHGRNPLEIHGEISKKSALKSEHFKRWLEIFRSIVDEMFEGQRADFAKLRAEAIANRMKNYVAGIPEVSAMTQEIPLKIESFPK